MRARRTRWQALLTRFRHILGQFNTAMLTTRGPDGDLRSRPMAIVGSGSEGDLWFISSLDSGKMDAIAADDRVSVLMQRGDTTFLSITGRARVVRDPERVKRLWRNDRSGWLRQSAIGPRDVAIRVSVEEVEYWDSQPGLRRVSSAVSRLVGEGQLPDEALDRHGRFLLV